MKIRINLPANVKNVKIRRGTPKKPKLRVLRMPEHKTENFPATTGVRESNHGAGWIANLSRQLLQSSNHSETKTLKYVVRITGYDLCIRLPNTNNLDLENCYLIHVTLMNEWLL